VKVRSETHGSGLALVQSELFAIAEITALLGAR